MHDVLSACSEENGLKFGKGQVDELTNAFFQDAPKQVALPGKAHGITLEALRIQLKRHGGLLQKLTLTIDSWLVPSKPKTNILYKFGLCKPNLLSLSYIQNNKGLVLFAILMALINMVLFAYTCVQFKDFKNWDGFSANYWVMLARASGNFGMPPYLLIQDPTHVLYTRV